MQYHKSVTILVFLKQNILIWFDKNNSEGLLSKIFLVLLEKISGQECCQRDDVNIKNTTSSLCGLITQLITVRALYRHKITNIIISKYFKQNEGGESIFYKLTRELIYLSTNNLTTWSIKNTSARTRLPGGPFDIW